MDRKPIVLFVNHLQHNCGVYQFFNHMVIPVVASSETYYYIETNEEWEHDHWVNQIKPEIVVYNFYFSGATMPWLTDYKVHTQSNRFKQIGIHHEGNIDSKGFDLILHQDPTNTNNKYFTLPRPIPEFDQSRTIEAAFDKHPIVGSFGFGLGGKGFTRVVETVAKEYNEATIRMNIPYAYFGDVNGDGARWWANACRNIAAHYRGIDLQISHGLLPEDQLLDFLASNDINCFFYDDNIGRGISGTTDYALAVKKPLAITHSDQFRHIWKDEILIEKNTIQDIIARGITPLEEFYSKWNSNAMIVAYEQAFSIVLEGR